MAQRALASISCSICLEYLTDPVTTPCGHSYCMKCLEAHWDQRSVYSCPQCRQSFSPRPALVKNTVLADLVEQLLTTGQTKSHADNCPAGPGDVACDTCGETRQKAVKSCLQCLASYCDDHIQPHHRSPVFKTHQLVAPSHHLTDYICSVHNKVLELFCRTDQQSICSLCSMDQHKDHHTVLAVEERNQLVKSIQDRETQVQELALETQALRNSAQETVQRSGDSFTRLILFLQRKWSEVEQQILSKLKSEESRAQILQEKLQQDITELKILLNDIDSMSLTGDHCHFLHKSLSLSMRPEASDPPQPQTGSRSCFVEIPASLSTLLYQLEFILSDGVDNLSQALSQDLHPSVEPSSREDFLRYHTDLTLDPNTAHSELALSEGSRRVTFVLENQRYPDHHDRFSQLEQVLSRESLTGRSYFEVEWSGSVVYIALAYKSIQRKGNAKESAFGCNDKSWAMDCDKKGYKFYHKDHRSRVLGPQGSRIGIYLDHGAGVLSFYSIKEQTMTLLHKVQTTFTQPLFAGLREVIFVLKKNKKTNDNTSK
uniref:Tripartite motif-containing protein 16-like n=1 Tax=Neogobius melanostomus TaxID=47308 RepID=A0A8C6WT31_9GOBI